MPVNVHTTEDTLSTDSGLQYQRLCATEGPAPTRSHIVEIHYRAELEDGTVFDSSYERGQPLTAPLVTLIKGLQEGLQRMAEGSQYRFVVPSHLGYGAEGAGPIPPDSTLIFEVELLRVISPKP